MTEIWHNYILFWLQSSEQNRMFYALQAWLGKEFSWIKPKEIFQIFQQMPFNSDIEKKINIDAALRKYIVLWIFHDNCFNAIPVREIAHLIQSSYKTENVASWLLLNILCIGLVGKRDS